MTRRVCLVIAITVALAAPSAFAQAAAEAALTHGFSSTAAAKAGTALGQSTNQAAGRVQQRMSQTVSGTQPSAPKHETSTQASVRTGTASVSSTISIQGQPPCAQANQKTPASDSKTAAASGTANCSAKDYSFKPSLQDKNKYKSVITLSFPK